MDEILIKACGVTYRKGQYITGVGRSTLELMKALSKINNFPFKLYYYTTGLRANNMDRTDIDFQYFKIPFPDKIIHITELDVLYRKYILRPNLVHIPHNYDDSYKEENLLLTIHDVWGYKNITNKKEKKKWERAVYNASCIVTCSQYSKSMIEETFNLPCSKVVSIPWGISSDFNKVSPAILSECKTRLNLPSRYFLSVSCSHPRKNIETLIKAFIQFNSKKREHKLVLVWSNPPKSILNLCQKNIENSDIIFLKYISDKDLVSVYNGATATFFPTRYEGFGFPILESFACNTPVVTCRNTSLPEVGGNIALYTDEDGVDEMSYYMELFENENFDLHLFREQAKNYIKRFSWENTALQYVELYKSLL